MTNISLCVCPIHVLMYWWVWGCVHILAIGNSVSMNTVCTSSWIRFFFNLDKYPEVVLIDHVVVLFLILWGIFVLFTVGATPIYIPTQSAQQFPYSTSSPTFVLWCLFHNSHSDRCKVISHCDFDLQFLMISDIEHLFHVPVSHLYDFFGKMYIQIHCWLFNQVMWVFWCCWISSLYILGKLPLSNISL